MVIISGCHSEQSEESHSLERMEILRCAQDDKFDILLGALNHRGKISERGDCDD